MQKFILTLTLLIFIYGGSFSQSCLPEGITFTTQAQIDNFQTNYPNCTAIEGDVKISMSDITNLNGLYVLTSIGGGLAISNNYALTSLTGLDNLISIGGYLEIAENDALTSLTGLEGLTSIKGNLYIISNDALTSLTGLDSVEANTISDLYIYMNPSLSTCDVHWLCDYLAAPTGKVNIRNNAIGCNSIVELANACGDIPCLPYGNYYFPSQSDIDNFQDFFPICTELHGDVYISGIDITDLSGMGIVTSIGEYLNIEGNIALNSLTGLENLTSIGGGLAIYNNNALTSLTGLESLTSIGDNLEIDENYALTSLTGLESLTSIGGGLDIYNNNALTSLTGLEGLTSVGSELFIESNYALTSLTGLNNLTSIGDVLYIRSNYSLTSLTGIENIAAGSINSLGIHDNHTLSNCAVQSVCDYLASPTGFVAIYDNATGCNNQQEVEANCKYGYEDYATSENRICIYPNPSSNNITITTPTTPNRNTTLTIFNIRGQQIIQRQIMEPHTMVDVSGFTSGIYFVKVVSDDAVLVGTFVKK